MPLNNSRKKTGKSRSGCRQCKLRRVKCDEHEPVCNNCSRRGLECPGYARGLRFSVKHERFLETQVAPAATSSPALSNTGSPRARLSQSAAKGIVSPASSSLYTAAQSSSESSGVADLDSRFNDAHVAATVDQGHPDMFTDWDDLSWLDNWNDEVQPTNGLGWTSAASASDQTVVVQGSKPSPDQLLSSQFFQSPIDLPTTLVEYWFSHVCPMWSSFDSNENYNRKVAVDTWTTSEPVFYALQAMSAACLADSMPRVQSVLPALITQATAAIKNKMSHLRNSPDVPALSINIDLLFAVFAMGTSLHWTNTSKFGDEMLQDAREALGILVTNLSAVDAMVHTYFHQALTYWEMIYSMVEREPPNNYRLDCKRLKYQTRLRRAIQLNDLTQPIEQPQVPVGVEVLQTIHPHSWCGVSTEVIDLFGQVLALCRAARIRHRGRKDWTAAAASDALSDIGVAHDLQKELLAMDFNDLSDGDKLRGVSLQTGDEKTPISHLVHIAEAYRLASLIQLYLTFDDLQIKRSLKGLTYMSPTSTKLPIAEDVPRAQNLVALSLELVIILEQVPAGSGSRCIHPPLLILAAAGLKMSVDSHDQEMSMDSGQQSFPMVDTLSGLQYWTSLENVDRQNWNLIQIAMLPPSQGIHPLSSDTPTKNLTITRADLEVANARQFIRGRLHALQTNLPPRPIKVALALVNAIWKEYDGSNPDSYVHWLDTMNRTGLQTIFG